MASTRISRQMRNLSGNTLLRSTSLRHSGSARRPQFSAFSSASYTPERDPTHPYLFYHPLPLPATNVFALAFHDKPFPSPKSKTILGWVSEGAGFQENPNFRSMLHDFLRGELANLKPGGPGFDETIEADAMQRGEGWMNIYDHRNVPALNRVGDPADLIGTVMVQDGKILPETYQPMPSYRICTSDGPTRLPDTLARKLVQYSVEELERE